MNTSKPSNKSSSRQINTETGSKKSTAARVKGTAAGKKAAMASSKSGKPRKPRSTTSRRRTQSGVRSRYRAVARLLRVMAWICALGAFWCAYLLWTINSYSAPKQYPQADTAIILGAALWNDVPSPGLKERLDHALSLYKQGIVSNMILSGGYDENGSKLSEAEGMRNYLVEQGVPENRLVLENRSTSTYENLLYSKPLAAERNWNKIIIVTHDYHATRAAEIADFLGYKDATTSGFKSRVLSMARNQFREVLAITKWKVDAFSMLIGLRPVDRG